MQPSNGKERAFPCRPTHSLTGGYPNPVLDLPKYKLWVLSRLISEYSNRRWRGSNDDNRIVNRVGGGGGKEQFVHRATESSFVTT